MSKKPTNGADAINPAKTINPAEAIMQTDAIGEGSAVNQAVESLAIIRGVIERTSRSFTAFSKIFIWWGLLFVLSSLLSLLTVMNKEQVLELSTQYPLLSYIFPLGVIGLAAAVIYWRISKQIPMVGLEQHLMKLWLLILIMNIIPAKVRIKTQAVPGTGESLAAAADSSPLLVEYSNFSILFFSLAIALIVTALLTGYKQLGRVGFIYIGLSVIYAYFHLPPFEDYIAPVLSLLALPFTFLYTGFYLKSRRLRGD